MTDQSGSYNLSTLRVLMIAAFDTDELRALISYDDNLSSLAREFAPTHPITVMVDETISWCDRRAFLPYLVQLVKQERPDKYKLFEPDLHITAIQQPGDTETAGPTPEILTITSPISLRLVRIPAGEFLMGSVAARDKLARDDEFPPHRVHVPEFHIGQYPVTNIQYRAFVKATERRAPYHWESGVIPRGKRNHPVVQVSWTEAVAFCAWLRKETSQPFRLPTEAEWEKAARGTDGRIWPWGDQPPDDGHCNFDKHAGDTTPIGRYSPQGDSPYGCADMAGNVWQWCSSAYKEYPYGAGNAREEMGGTECRVVRGGGWRNDCIEVRCAFRHGRSPGVLYYNCGFRVARGPLR